MFEFLEVAGAFRTLLRIQTVLPRDFEEHVHAVWCTRLINSNHM